MTLDPAAEAAALRDQLATTGTPERAQFEKGYLKSDLQFLGNKVPVIRKAAQAWYRAHKQAPRTEVTATVDALWALPIHDCRSAAIEVLSALGPTDADLPRIERMLRESKTWALVDALAVHICGPLVDGSPAKLLPALDRWATDDDFWIRRSALLALLLPLRRDPQHWPRFTRYADGMIGETEFFIRKAIGWVLRDVGKRRPGDVAEWLAPRTGRASGVTVREAVKYLPAGQRDELLAAYSEGRAAKFKMG